MVKNGWTDKVKKLKKENKELKKIIKNLNEKFDVISELILLIENAIKKIKEII